MRRLLIALYLAAVLVTAAILLRSAAPDLSPVRACLLLAAVGGASAGVYLLLAAEPRFTWSAIDVESLGLVLGSVLLFGSLGYATSYLHDRPAPADVRDGYSAGASLSFTGDAAASGRLGRARSKAAFLVAELRVRDCGDPVEATVVYWPPRDVELRGRFHLEVQPGGSSIEQVRDPASVRRLAFSDDDPFIRLVGPTGSSTHADALVRLAPEGRNAISQTGLATNRDPATRRRPVVTTVALDWLVRRNQSSCYLQLPGLSAVVTTPIRRKPELPVAETRNVVRTTADMRVPEDASHPAPTESRAGVPQWTCGGATVPCSATVVIERADATNNQNFTLLVVGTLLGLGTSMCIQSILALVASRRRRSS